MIGEAGLTRAFYRILSLASAAALLIGLPLRAVAEPAYTVLSSSAAKLPDYLPLLLTQIRSREAEEGISVSSSSKLEFGHGTAFFTSELQGIAREAGLRRPHERPLPGRPGRGGGGSRGIRTVFDLEAQTVRKKVLLKSGGAAMAYAMELEDGGYKPAAVSAGGRDWQIYAGERGAILYTQAKGASGAPELKEWIYALKPREGGRTAYSWRVTGSPSATVTLKKEADGGVGIYSPLPVSGIAESDVKARREVMATIEKALKMPVTGERLLGRVEPPVYWTAAGEKRKAELEIKGDADRLEFSVEAAPGEYPLLIDPTLNWGQWFSAANPPTGPIIIHSIVYEPSSGKLFAGGEAVGNPDEVVPSYGVLNNDFGEGFVVKISTGSSPVCEWLQWVGGDGYDNVFSVAVNGNEIYAGGYSESVTNWESAASDQGTFSGSNEGFVVEIGDGASPTLNWRQWLGGTGSFDWVNAVAVNGDEIYAAGASYSATGWESVTFQGACSGDREGFVVEIADGVSPALNWGQWLGGTNKDEVWALAVEGDEIYAGGISSVTTAGWESVTFQGAHSGGREGFVVEIADGAAPALNWGQWLGGLADDEVYALAVTGDEIYAGGYTSLITSWESATYNQGSYSGSAEGFVAEIVDGATPALNWRQMLGGTGNDYVTAVSINGDEIYAGGYAFSAASWESATYNQGTHSGGSEGFVVEIQDTPVGSNLIWRQWLGGTGVDHINGIAVTGDDIYPAGYSTSGSSWEAFTFQGNNNGIEDEGIVLKINDGAPPTMGWGQWLGAETSAGGDVAVSLYSVAVGQGAIFLGGSASGPLVDITMYGTYSGAEEGVVLKIIDGAAPAISWGQWLGGDSYDVVTSVAVNGSEIYAAGFIQGTGYETATYNQGTFSGFIEGYVAEIADGASPTLNWLQWLGGTGTLDWVNTLAVNGDEIYAGGDSDSATGWESVTFQGTHSGGSEGFVVEIGDGSPPTLNWGQWLGGSGDDQVLSLAVNGDEIYAGGVSSAPVTGWESVTFQGAYSGYAEGFVVEIADGASPALNWGQWLGGTNDDKIYAVAVSGDEVYAGGYSESSANWESAASNQGTHNENWEGFVVEIGDGATPALNWRQWLGGSGGSEVYGITVNGDEIYALGNSDIETGWESTAISRGSITGFGDVFVQAIVDGVYPKLTWRQWLGGDTYSMVWAGGGAALAGDKLYLVGESESGTGWENCTFYGTHPGGGLFLGFLIKLLLPCDACFQSPGF